MVREIYSSSYDGIDLYLAGDIYSVTSDGVSSAIGFTYAQNKRRVIVQDIDYSIPELRYTVFHELMHIIDDKLEKAEAETGIPYLSGWLEFLPKHVNYYNSYRDKKGNEITDASYTRFESDENLIYFYDPYSKTYPTEDRARVFEYLMHGYDGDDDALYGDHLLEKARYLCVVLRQCFDCLNADDPTVLPWESILGETDMHEFDGILSVQSEAAG